MRSTKHRPVRVGELPPQAGAMSGDPEGTLEGDPEGTLGGTWDGTFGKELLGGDCEEIGRGTLGGTWDGTFGKELLGGDWEEIGRRLGEELWEELWKEIGERILGGTLEGSWKETSSQPPGEGRRTKMSSMSFLDVPILSTTYMYWIKVVQSWRTCAEVGRKPEGNGRRPEGDRKETAGGRREIGTCPIPSLLTSPPPAAGAHPNWMGHFSYLSTSSLEYLLDRLTTS